MKKNTRLVLGFALAAIFLWLIFRHLSLDEIKAAFGEAKSPFVLAAVIVFFLGYSCRIERWRLMLRQDNPNLEWRNCAGPLMASVAANNVLPFRAGDILRAFGFNQRLGISAATSVTTLFVERLLDLLMVVTFLGLALAYFGMESARFIGVGGTFLIAGAAVIAFLLLFPGLFKPLAFWLGRKVSKISPKLGEKIRAEIHKVFDALGHMTRGHTMVKLILWSMLAWIAEGFVFWLAALALPSVFHPIAAWIALPIGTLATVIPSTPGYVGTFDFFTTQAMTVLGNTTTAATAYALLIHALLWLPPTIAGGLYLLLNPVGLTQNRVISATETQDGLD
jgi:glycosyltransferase 2 family protein